MPQENQPLKQETTYSNNNTGSIMQETLVIVKGNQPINQALTVQATQLPSTVLSELEAFEDDSLVSYQHWKPDVHKQVIGVITGWSTFEHPKYGKQSTMLVLDKHHNGWSIILNQYLQEGARRENASTGDLVKLVANGKSPQGYRLYDLRFKKREGSVLCDSV